MKLKFKHVSLIFYALTLNSALKHDVNFPGQEIKLQNLMPNTRYMFSVRARNEVGVGQPYEYTEMTAAHSMY